MIQEAKQKRRERLDNSNNMIVYMKPEFASALQNSINYSVKKGRSAFLLNQSAKRRSKPNQLEVVKDGIAEHRKSQQKYLQDSQRMSEEFEGMKDKIVDLLNYKKLVIQLHDDGILDNLGHK